MDRRGFISATHPEGGDAETDELRFELRKHDDEWKLYA